jgi:Lar family restriction alleviation protein
MSGPLDGIRMRHLEEAITPLGTKPCPFCGSDHTMIDKYRHGASYRWIVRCESCGSDGPASDSSSGAALRKWTERYTNQ